MGMIGIDTLRDCIRIYEIKRQHELDIIKQADSAIKAEENTKARAREGLVLWDKKLDDLRTSLLILENNI